MDPKTYKALTEKQPPKTKPRSKPLPKAKLKYLEAEEDFQKALDVLGIKYEKKFHFKSTKHWRFDFHLIEHRILVEISGGPWSGGRRGRLANKAWSMDRYDHAAEMGFTVVRLESANRYKIDEFGPLQIEAQFASQWLKNLKRESFNGPDQTIPANGSD
ncbi:hypothetical protein [Acinetobacter tandoii]|uniref:DUF559 domain-containing protein n=1 Tax=Acinetobacter tandoii DSM 14970 = CIP 107469 TaxID=1120927 RepID=R9AUV6_9GAMM|nr:hypothetical protein [Acinetobacter tandoii]EOR06002.1 hypothetical protein I593_02820 [Acinetobacter tandoii DSM 14970 = CIP 107469]